MHYCGMSDCRETLPKGCRSVRSWPEAALRITLFLVIWMYVIGESRISETYKGI